MENNTLAMRSRTSSVALGHRGLLLTALLVLVDSFRPFSSCVTICVVRKLRRTSVIQHLFPTIHRTPSVLPTEEKRNLLVPTRILRFEHHSVFNR
jgi:hypothetical protein